MRHIPANCILSYQSLINAVMNSELAHIIYTTMSQRAENAVSCNKLNSSDPNSLN